MLPRRGGMGREQPRPGLTARRGAGTLPTSLTPPRSPGMATADLPRDTTLADLLERIGDVPPARIRLNPPLGRATEKDLLRLQRRTDRHYELVEGVLVEKTMGFSEAALAL